ncbi:MAG: class I SAM-dependent methyltransferase [Bacteroidota bacterium]
MTSIIERIHGRFVHTRRDRRLRELLATLIPPNAHVLDVGCGDGLLAKMILAQRPDVHLTGIDVLVRDNSHIPVQYFDGKTIPHPDSSIDVILFVDVLHHTDDPTILLKEAVRVSRGSVLIKDHTMNGLFARATLRFMDEIGNRRHGVALPYNYWTRQQWMHAIGLLHLNIATWIDRLRLYPVPADWIFGRSLHFIAKLDVHRAMEKPR